jgi:hypothetical protein
MRWWSNKYLIFLFVFSLLIQASYGQEITQTPNDTNQSQKNGISSSSVTTTQNITIELNSTNNLPVREATVEVIDVTDNETKYLLTNDNGLAFFQAKNSKTYRFVIEAEGYENVNKNVTILAGFSENKIKFTLKSQKDSDFWPLLVPAVLGFITFLYWSIRFNYRRVIPHNIYEWTLFNLLLVILTVSWPLITIYLLFTDKINILLGGLSFSVYIVVAALLGILSYLLLSIEEIFTQTIPKYKKMSILWGYIRRITIAPYIAILGVYVLLDAAKMQNMWFILLFSFIAGMFTKTIEAKLYGAVQGLLPEEKLKEFNDRGLNYSIENSELVVRLNVDADVAYTLYECDIRSVEQLAVLKVNKVNGYLFSWDEISGNDSGRLIEFLKRNYNIDWVETAKIEKIDDRTIIISNEKKSLLLKLNNKKTIVNLIIDDVRTDVFIAKIESDKLNIYVNGNSQDDCLEKNVEKKIRKEYLEKIVKEAINQKASTDKLKQNLNLTTSDMDLLINRANIYSITDFAYSDLDSIDWGMKTPSDNKKITDLFKQKQNKAKSIASSEEDLKFLTLDDLKKLHADFKDKTPEDYIEIVKLHTEIREKGISNWTVEDTKKLFDQHIKTLDELKTRCIKQGTDNVKKDFKGISVISELIDKIIQSKTLSS